MRDKSRIVRSRRATAFRGRDWIRVQAVLGLREVRVRSGASVLLWPTFSPAEARRIAQLLLDAADRAEEPDHA